MDRLYEASISKSLASIAESAERAAAALEKLSREAPKNSSNAENPESRKKLDDTIRDILMEQAAVNDTRKRDCQNVPEFKTVGERIKAARKTAGLTQEELSQKLGVKRSTLAKYEHGDIGITVSMLYKVSDALHVSVLSLIPITKNRGTIDDQIPLSSTHPVPEPTDSETQ